MALKFTGRRWHDDQTGTVTFPAWSGQTRIQCRITDEALMFMFGAIRTDSGLIEAFDRNLHPIQVAAAWKFESSKEPVQITLGSNDFPDRKPQAPPDAKQMSPEEMRRRMDELRRSAPRADDHAAALALAEPSAEQIAAEEAEEQKQVSNA